MKIITLTRNDNLASNCYILICDGTYSVIDPAVGYESAAEKHPELSKLAAKYVILTHAHIDHMWEIESYVARGGKVLVSNLDADKLADPIKNCAFLIKGNINAYKGEYSVLNDGDTVNFGEQSFVALLTPGHTSGSMCIMGDHFGFTGDTLFEGGGYGRYDLPTGNRDDIFSSLEKLFKYPDDFIIYPGHAVASTIKETKKYFCFKERG